MRNYPKFLLIILCLCLSFFMLVSCKDKDEPKDPVDPNQPGDENPDEPEEPEVLKKHLILDEFGNYGGTTNKSRYGMGAPLNGEYDQEDSIYYLVNDFYNMKSTEDRTILPKFAPYQQTMADSGGLACALMILNYFGEDIRNTYNEVELVKLYEQLNGTEVYGNGTNAQGIKKLFNQIGYSAVTGYKESGSTTDDKIANFITWALLQLNQGRLIMVRYQDDREFGWHVIIGLDTMGTAFPRDDVLIMADPYDSFDHFQDGYVTSAAGRFYRWWQNVEQSGKTTDAFDCVVVYPKKVPTITRVQEERKITQIIPDRHLLLNPDGSFGGTRDAKKYGVINEKNGETDQLTSNYHAFVDYYNMDSSDTRLILKGYMAFQQTMASSCGICSTLSVLNYYGIDVNIYDEVFLTEKYCEVNEVATIYNVGVGSSGLKKLLNSLGYVAEGRSFARDSFVNSSSMIFPTYEKFLTWVKTNLSKGTPMPVSWRPHGGHWEVIIGIDTMGTDYIYDDVLVLADSHDTWDHYQDGYNTLPANLFYRQWYNGSFTYNQQYCIFDKKK